MFYLDLFRFGKNKNGGATQKNCPRLPIAVTIHIFPPGKFAEEAPSVHFMDILNS